MKLKFIHLPKAGGSSIWDMFGSSLLFPQKPYKIERYGWHQIYDELVKDPGVISFTISRNPYDRCVSAFHYLRAGGVNSADTVDGQKWCNYNTFEEFCLDPMGLEDASNNQLHFLPQVSFIPHGVDMIGSLENLDLFLDKLCNIADIKRPTNIHTNKSSHKHWSSYYEDPNVVKIVSEIYKDDFIKFGYDPKKLK